MIRFKYLPTFKDYWALNRRFLFRQMRTLFRLSCVALALYALSPFLLRMSGQEKTALEIYRSWLPSLFVPGLMIFTLIANFFGSKKRWNAAEELRVEKEYEIDESGVQVRGEGVNGFLDWRYVTTAEYSGGRFFLKTAQNQFHYFPRAAVPDTERLVALLKRKVGDTKGLEKARR